VSLLLPGRVSARAEGAIAQCDDGRFGLSYNQSSAETADVVCAERLWADCRVVEHFHAACAAVARIGSAAPAMALRRMKGRRSEAFSVCKRRH
jgi:hypothetical protein